MAAALKMVRLAKNVSLRTGDPVVSGIWACAAIRGPVGGLTL